MFGVPFNVDDQIIQPLESQGFRRLHPQNYDHKRELKKLNHSILVNFLEIEKKILEILMTEFSLSCSLNIHVLSYLFNPHVYECEKLKFVF
jgi:hypothetical protein